MRCLRMYADQNGDSHFEDVEVEMSCPPAEHNMELSSSIPSGNVGFRRFPPGWDTRPEPASGRLLVFILTGEVELTVSDGTVRRVGPSSVVLVEDIWGRGHTARVVSEEHSLQAVVQLPERSDGEGFARSADHALKGRIP